MKTILRIHVHPICVAVVVGFVAAALGSLAAESADRSEPEFFYYSSGGGKNTPHPVHRTDRDTIRGRIISL